ncbi:phosphate acyltransferase PlsX [Halalkalibaculum sp. DA3122]|uniref:phosphate acyltransferase PlsX n=1 Tax=unclassified Halalkalibaculum TaxID=2964617 RepID=UPI003754FC6C
MIIAVDAAGGDHYPESPVRGAMEAVEERDSLHVVLLGPEDMVRKELDKHGYDGDKISVQNAPEIIGMDESPAQAVKSKRNSSIVAGLGMQKAGQCNGFVSAGNTGALLAASTFILGKLEGVTRPTIAATFPTIKGFRLLLDAGANLEVRPEMYFQFAQMGAIYASEVMKISDPKIGLINIGEEKEKGTEVVKEAYKLLEPLPEFVGNIEGGDIFNAAADVYVCDGFVGNVLLKFGESIPRAVNKIIESQLKKEAERGKPQSPPTELLQSSLSMFNPENVGGVPFLGVNGVSMVGHGGSSALAVKNMIFNAVKCVENNINEKIIASLNS